MNHKDVINFMQSNDRNGFWDEMDYEDVVNEKDYILEVIEKGKEDGLIDNKTAKSVVSFLRYL